MPKKRVIRKLDLNEISAVDKPAHRGATIDIQKRDQDYDVDKALTIGVSAYWYEICCAYDVKWSIEKFNRLVEKELPLVAMYIQKMYDEYQNEDEEIEIPEDSALAAFLTEKSLSKLIKTKEDKMSEEAKTEEVEKELESVKAENERLAKVVGLSAAHKAHYDAIDELEEDVRAKFLAMTPEQRDEVVSKAKTEAEKAAADKDPVVYKAMDGTEYRESDGAHVVRLAKQLDEQAKAGAVAKAKEFDSDVTKRAETEFKHLPGDLDTRKALVASVLKIEDEKTREAALDSLRAKSAGNAKLSVASGTSVTPSEEEVTDKSEANTALENKAKELAKAENIDYYVAYRRVVEDASNIELVAKAQ